MTIDKIYDYCIIGSGPAGLSAAIMASSEGESVLVIERSNITGGQIGTTSRVENYPGVGPIVGRDLADTMEQQARHFGTDIQLNTEVISIKRDDDNLFVAVCTSGNEYRSKACLLATGAIIRDLGFSNEYDLMHRGLLFKGHPNKTRDYTGKTVVLLGGGNSAGQSAMFLAENGASDVYIIAKHPLADTMSNYLIKELHATDGITILENLEAIGIDGYKFFESVLKTAVHTTRKDITIIADEVYNLTGWVPDKLFKDFQKDGHLCDYPEQGIFTAGDCRVDSIKRCTYAVGDGIRAIRAAREFIKQNQHLFNEILK